MTEIAIIAAVAQGGLVGGPDGMPWNVPEDMKHFREMTTGHTVIMGRTTWESLPGPLKNRQNIVLTSQSIDGIETAPSLTEAIELSVMPGEIFVIGGVRPWTEALEVASTIYLTYIDADFEGDVFFPDFDQTVWKKESELVQEALISGTIGTLKFTKYTKQGKSDDSFGETAEN